MSSRTSTRRKKLAGLAPEDEDSRSQRSRRERSPSIVFLYERKSAPPPFNAEDADLILHTSAGTPFRLNMHTICQASPVLAADLNYKPSSFLRTVLPRCIERNIPESDFVLETLLRFIYCEEPALFDLDDIVDVLQAATKYKIRAAIQGLAKTLRSPALLDKDPLRVFSIARRFQLEDTHAVFRRAVLKHPVQWPPTMHDPEQDSYLDELYDAVKYRRKITFAAISLIEDPSRLRSLTWDRVPGGKPPCGGTCWWPLYADRARPALHETPLSDVVCSASFVASVGLELKCVDCRERLLCVLLPDGFIEQLRHDIDALPDAVSMMVSTEYHDSLSAFNLEMLTSRSCQDT